jgi:flagellar motor switch protein FliM
MSGGNVLSVDAIAALVEAAKEGTLPEEPTVPARKRRVQAVDFTRPTKFSSDQERRIRRAMETFCRTATSRLSAELRAPLELELIASSQLTYSHAHSQVPEGALTALITIDPVGTKMMLAGEQTLLLGAIELFSGGTEPGLVKPRRFTDIDWALATHFFDRLLGQMSVIWADMFALELSTDTLDQHLETAQSAPVSEPTLSLTIEARLDGTSSTLVLLLPWQAIAPVIERFSGREEKVEARDGQAADSVRRAVGGVEVPVRAEIAGVHLPIEAVLALEPGDMLHLHAPADAGVTLYADKVPVHRAKPGRSGSRRAVQVTVPATPGGAR